MKKWLIIGLVLLIAVLFLMPAGGLPSLVAESVVIVLFGWMVFLKETLSVASVGSLAIGVGAALLAILITFDVVYRASDARSRRIRWGLSIVGVVAGLFAAAICLFVTIRESESLLTAKKPLTYLNNREYMRRVQSVNNLKQIGLGFYGWHDAKHRFPPGGTFNEFGEMQHSWQTMLLPYMEYSNLKPDLKLPWSHPNNKKCFEVRSRNS